MRIFISSEMHISVADLFMPVQKQFEEKFNDSLKEKDYGAGLKEIALVPIILPKDWIGERKERRLLKRQKKALRTTV